MATTSSLKIGRIKKKLAKMLEEAMPGTTIDPTDLNSQIPVYATPQWDCCSWYGYAYKDGVRIGFASWDTMTKCVKSGFTVSFRDNQEIEVIANGHS